VSDEIEAVGTYAGGIAVSQGIDVEVIYVEGKEICACEVETVLGATFFGANGVLAMANVVDVKNLVSDGVGVKEIDVVLHAVTVNGVARNLFLFVDQQAIAMILMKMMRMKTSSKMKRS